jgi:hypothetical protein
MSKLFSLPLFIILLSACSSEKKEKPVNNLLLPTNIQSQIFTIPTDQDQELKTSHGTLLKIKKNTFPGSSPVSIEIKEAFTPDEILLSGIATTSNGKPLRSAGMLYFNASSNGKPIKPQIPVRATIPTSNLDREMQVFKGEITADSSINWVAPSTSITHKQPGPR